MNGEVMSWKSPQACAQSGSSHQDHDSQTTFIEYGKDNTYGGINIGTTALFFSHNSTGRAAASIKRRETRVVSCLPIAIVPMAADVCVVATSTATPPPWIVRTGPPP